MNYNPAEVAMALSQALETGWNAGDAEAFAAPFADYADFVDSHADHHRGRKSIQWGHTALFETIFKGSQVHYDVTAARLLTPEMLLAQMSATLTAPVGPMAGENHSTLSILARLKDGEWRIELFHNTLAPREMTAAEAELRQRIR